MATRRGPQLPILTYDTASEAARVMRTDVADPIEARGVIAPTERPDRFMHPRP
jgi:hypothetical protein